MLGNIPVKFQESRPNGFCLMRAAKSAILYANFNVSRAITQKRSGEDNPKYEGAQHLMLGNSPVKFQDSRPDCS